MITATASAIKGPILSDLSGCLGKSGVQQLWPLNLVPAQLIVLGNAVYRAYNDFPGHGSHVCSGKLMPRTYQNSRPKTSFYAQAVPRRAQGNGAIPVGHGPKGLYGSWDLGVVQYLTIKKIPDYKKYFVTLQKNF